MKSDKGNLSSLDFEMTHMQKKKKKKKDIDIRIDCSERKYGYKNRKFVELDSVVFWVQEIGCSTLIDLLDVKQ